MIICGIDPSLNSTGWAIVKLNKDTSITYISSGVIRHDSKLFQAEHLHQKIHEIYKTIHAVFTEYSPNMVFVEDVFVSQNASVSLKLGMVRGAIVVASSNHNIECTAISPKFIKQTISGYGGANKSQIHKMIGIIIPTLQDVAFKYDDETDAIAISITGCFSLY